MLNNMIINWWLELTTTNQAILIYLVVINLITFFYFGLDKLLSQIQKRRIRERTLWTLALVGGSIGALLGINFFRHKTKKMSFQAGLAIILAVQVVLLLLVV